MQTLSKHLDSAPFLRNREPEFLASILKKLNSNPHILEIGTFRGLSAVLMAQVRKDAAIITIDSHVGVPQCNLFSSYDLVISNLKKYGVKNVQHLQLSSQNFHTELLFDLIFIDGSHLFENVSFDYNKFKNNLKKGGFMIFHDYGTHRGVTKLCDSLGTPTILFKSMAVYQL